MMNFSDAIQKICPDIRGQDVSELRELLITAHQRLQADSKLLAVGLQSLKKSFIDEGYDWSDLIEI